MTRPIDQEPPTPREREVAAAVREHRNAAAAAKALGVSRVTVEITLARYHVHYCSRRITELEAELASSEDRRAMDKAAWRLEQVVARIERAVLAVDHRRIRDGGRRVKVQRREAAG